MEAVTLLSASLFISLMIVAVVQIIKMFVPAVSGAVTVIVALVVGAVVGLVDQHIGVTDVSVAQGIVDGLGAIGLATLAGKAGGGTVGDNGTTLTQRG